MVSQIDKRKNRVVLSLGGNMGDVKQVFKDALGYIEKEIGELAQLSSVYKTKAWGIENQPDFLNQVIIVESSFLPAEVLKKCLEIESELGRVRKEKWGERIIDIDLLFYNDELIKSEDLTLPHPYIQERNFILYPLVEILPNYIHPKFKKTLFDLKNDCKDQLPVVKI